jgi:hypothetical protein
VHIAAADDLQERVEQRVIAVCGVRTFLDARPQIGPDVANRQTRRRASSMSASARMPSYR